MTENNQENQIYFFSKKVLLLSLLFMALNVLLYGLVIFQQKVINFNEVSPKIIFSEKNAVTIKTPFDTKYLDAKSDQSILVGSLIKTDDKGYAEIVLGGNVVRMDKNTEVQLIENNFKSRDLPRFVLRLDSGGVWVNAFDPVEVLTPQTKAHFVHTVGAVMYSDPLNRIFSVTGNIDMTFYDDAGAVLAKFVVPLKNQIAFADSQLIKDYARLEYSKLKKELKMGPISSAILDDVWVKNNISDEMNQMLAGENYIYSFTDYNFRSNYHNIRAKLALIPARERIELLNLATVKLKYLLGGVNFSNDTEQAETILDEFSALYDQLKDDPLLNDLIETQFYTIRNVRTDTPAYLVKEKLRQILIEKNKDTEIFRTYLADIDYLLRVGEIQQSEAVADGWLKQWNDGFRKKFRDEFEKQSRIFHSIILAYADKITPRFLSILDTVGDYRLSNAINYEETLYEIALERLEVSRYFVSVYRYTDARTYLKTSYSKLNLSGAETSAAARELFIKEATLLADRIAFAEQSLKASASNIIDEAKFRDYLDEQERDKSLAERFITFMQETQKPAEIKIVYPTVEDVAGLFAQNRIIVLHDDIAPDTENKFEFDIKNGRFIDRSDDGLQIIFSARLDYSNKALFNITLNDKPLRGNFTLADFIQVAINGEKEIEIDHLPEDISQISDFINLNDTDAALRSQAISQDLSVQLMIKELEQYKILVSSAQQIIVLNTTSLDEFKVNNVFIEDPDTKRKIMVSFEYNLGTKMVSRILLKEGVDLGLPSQLKISEFISTVFTAIFGKEEEIQETQKAVTEISALGFSLDASNIKFQAGGYTMVGFTDIRLKLMPIEISGIYNRNTKIFAKVEHLLLSSSNTVINEYIKQLSELWVIDNLGKNGITINKDNIFTPLPAEKVDIKNYARGSKIINFTFDAKGNRLINISVKGISTIVTSMTFEEFSVIDGGSSGQTTQPSQPQSTGINGTCADFSERLKNCVNYSCEFPEPVTGANMLRRISGLVGDKCRYIEQMPNNQYMECNYSAEYRVAVAQQHADQLTLGNIITASSFGSESSTFTYTIGGITVTNPAKDALTNGQCIIGNQ